MIRPRRSAQPRVRRRINPGKRSKLIRKVRLVVVPALQRQLRPRHIHARVQLPHHALKALHPAPHLRRTAHARTAEAAVDRAWNAIDLIDIKRILDELEQLVESGELTLEDIRDAEKSLQALSPRGKKP